MIGNAATETILLCVIAVMAILMFWMILELWIGGEQDRERLQRWKDIARRLEHYATLYTDHPTRDIHDGLPKALAEYRELSTEPNRPSSRKNKRGLHHKHFSKASQ